MRRPTIFLAAGLSCLATSSCGSAQERPAIVSVFPASGQVLTGWLDYIRVTYDEPITVLNPASAKLAGVVSGAIDTQIFKDPADDRSVLVKPIRASHFFANEEHHLVVEQGAVINAKDHYALDPWDSYFTVGPAPHLFVTSNSGSVYELDAATGAQVFVTAPIAGYRARDPVATDGRVWVWLDPFPGPGDSLLGTFTPGTATISQTVALSGEIGPGRIGGHLAVSIDGRSLYATVRDAGTNRLRIHRVDAATQAQSATFQLSPPLSGPTPVWRPALDSALNRLYLPFTAGANGAIAVVDLVTFTEVDVGPLPGLDAAFISYGAGDIAYDLARDRGYMVISTGTVPGYVIFSTSDFAPVSTSQPGAVGAPVTIFPTPDGGLVLQGLSGYPPAGLDAMAVDNATKLNEGIVVAITDDVGAGPRGSTRLGVLLRDPAATRLIGFLDNGVATSLAAIEWIDLTVTQTDLDGMTGGTQAIDLALSAPGVVTGAAFMYGTLPP